MGGREPSGSAGLAASLPSQGWQAKVTNGETEARVVHGVALRAAGAGQGVSDPVAHPVPRRHFGRAAGKPCRKSLKIKGAVGRGCATVRASRAAREFGGFGGKVWVCTAGSWHRTREMPVLKGMGAAQSFPLFIPSLCCS